MEFDPKNIDPWLIHWLPFFEKQMDPRLVMILKLRTGMIDGIKHTYEFIGKQVKHRSKSKLQRNDYISGTRAKELYDKASRNLMHHHSRYISEADLANKE